MCNRYVYSVRFKLTYVDDISFQCKLSKKKTPVGASFLPNLRMGGNQNLDCVKTKLLIIAYSDIPSGIKE